MHERLTCKIVVQPKGPTRLTSPYVPQVKLGKPDGKLAKAGKKVAVEYVGKLKKNGKVFDQSGGKPFVFRLGAHRLQVSISSRRTPKRQDLSSITSVHSLSLA